MAQRRFHYEQAFEHYLRANRLPYIAVDEAKKSLLPPGSFAPGHHRSSRNENPSSPGRVTSGGAVKSFDFVVYAPGRNLLVDVKGRMFGSGDAKSTSSNRRLENWVTIEDVEGLARWRELFGSGFEPIFIFLYCLRQQPPDALFEEVFAFGDRWYSLREVALDAYEQEMTERSARWGTVHVPRDVFARISRPFNPAAAPPPPPRPPRNCLGRNRDAVIR